MVEQAFVSNSGSAHARFRRAIERDSLILAEATARELGAQHPLPLSDSLDLLLLIARKEPHRFERAATRWHGRFECEIRGVDISDAQLLLGALGGLRNPVPELELETIARIAERLRAQSITVAARRAQRG